MALYFSAHNIACLTKRDLRSIMQNLHTARDVQIIRSVASQFGGRMIVESDALDQKTLETFFTAHHFNCEWVMRIDLDARKDSIQEY